MSRAIRIIALLACGVASTAALADPMQPANVEVISTPGAAAAPGWRLDGIMSSQGRLRASINSKWGVVGDEIDGASIRSIGRDQVELMRRDGKTINLRLLRPEVKAPAARSVREK